MPLQKLFAAAKDRRWIGLAALALLFAVQISPWLYPSVDGCLYLKTVSDFFSAQRLDDFCCLVPPGYPVLIAPAFVFGDRPFLAVSILQWLLAVAMIGGIYVWARRLMPSAALALTAAVAVNISLWTFYRRPTKEIATLAVLMWTVNAMHGLLEERRRTRVILLTAAVGLLTAYLVLIRYAAITLPVAFAVAAGLLARRGEFRPARAIGMSAVILLMSTATLASWLVYDKTHGTGGTYLDAVVSIYRSPSVTDPQSQDVDADAGPDAEGRKARHLSRGVLYRVNDLTCLTIPGFWKSTVGPGSGLSASIALGALVFGVLAIGWWRILSIRLDVLALLFPIYFLLYAHWDCAQPGGRFLLPMLPIILACVGTGLAAILRYVGPTGGRRWQIAPFAAWMLAHLGQATGYWLLIDAPRAYACQQNLPIVDQLAGKIRTHAGLVAVAPSLEQSCNGLWLDLDWKRLRIRQMPLPRRVEWIVERTGSQPVDGFSVECIAGPFQLLRREPAAESLPARVGRSQAPGRLDDRL